MDRVFNINKDPGMTSHDVVYRVRKILGIKKVGHTGTLDPDATGVLPICVGRSTKLSDLILNKEKTYICEMKLGIETDTYDSSGEIIFEKSTENISNEKILEALLSQVGEIDQFPPMYSALKVNGKRMCDLVRSGRESEIKLISRKIKINKINVLKIDIPYVSFEVDCSKGTYVRSICHDVGEILGVGAHMTNLIRTRSGVFKLEDTITLAQLEEYKDKNRLIENSYSVEDVLKDLPKIILVDNAVKYYSNGGEIFSNRFDCEDTLKIDDLVRVYSKDDFIGIGKISQEDGKIKVKSEKIFKME